MRLRRNILVHKNGTLRNQRYTVSLNWPDVTKWTPPIFTNWGPFLILKGTFVYIESLCAPLKQQHKLNFMAVGFLSSFLFLFTKWKIIQTLDSDVLLC